MEAPKKKLVYSLVGLVVAIVYLVIPVDLAPDAIPVLGYLDDAALLITILTQAIRWAVKLRK